jgi:hypothetical protein
MEDDQEGNILTDSNMAEESLGLGAIRAEHLRSLEEMINSWDEGDSFFALPLPILFRHIQALASLGDDDTSPATTIYGTIQGQGDFRDLSTMRLQPSTTTVPEEIDCFLRVYDNLGRAMGANSTCGRHVVIDMRENISIRAVCQILQHLGRLQCLEWSLPPSDFAIFGDDNDYETLRSILLQKLALPEIRICIGRLSDSFNEMSKFLLSLHVETVSFAKDTANPTDITGAHVASLAPYISASSCKTFTLHELSFDNATTAWQFGRAIGMSTATCLMVFGLPVRRTDIRPECICGALQSSSALQILRLRRIDILPFDLSMSFCAALSTLSLHELELDEVHVHDDAIDPLCRAVCRPSLTKLQIRGSSRYLNGTSASLKNCQELLVCRFECIDFNNHGNEDLLLNALAGFCACPRLVEISLPSGDYYSNQVDEALAKCLTKCPRLLRVFLHLPRFSSDDNGIDLPTGQHVIAACRKHLFIEEISLLESNGDSNRSRSTYLEVSGQIRACTDRNNRHKLYQGRFDSMAMDPSLLAKVLSRVSETPHLTYLALSTYKNLFVGRDW